MKKAIILIGLFFIVNNAINAAQMKQFYVKSGKVTYKLGGNATGSSVMFWEDYGYQKTILSDGTFNMLGITKKYKKTEVIIGPDKYEKKEDDGKVEKYKNKSYLCWQKNKTDNIGKLTTALMTDRGFKKVAKWDKICGLDCSVWKKKKTTIWIHQGLMMKMKTAKMGVNVTITAIKVEKNITVPKDTFKIPS